MMESFNRWFMRVQFGTKTRTRVFRKLVRFLGNSVSLSAALDIMYEHASDDGKKPKAIQAVVLDEWRRSIRDGKTFGQAIQGWVPDSDRLVIEGGEKAGDLPTAIEKSILIGQSVKQIRSAIIAGLAYPLVLVAAAIGFMVIFGVEVIPEFETVMPREQWTGAGAHMALMSDFVHNWLAIVLTVVVALVVLSIFSMSRWTGRLRVRFDKIPPWSFYRLVVGSGFLLTVSGMLKSGIAVPNILSTLQRGAKPYYRERLYHTAQNVKNGHNLGAALHMTGFDFPDKEAVQDIRSYADLNRFNESLEMMGTEWLDDSVDLVKQQSGIVRNASIILLGVVFAWIASGIFSLQQQISNSL
ncbi:type II secretion system F family protein [Roseibium sp. RKSG952]|uniref:type II secretion system F family protein n=1 Tax=Roseibium sp. RKSG952 TaxID=2529384 RepID=UPI0012BBD8D4|nr:type II secretion system F family protein [Roseibium sp. RKSG952]MTH97585.1 pilus assembly protein [Roseibium sp. RKSG952]